MEHQLKEKDETKTEQGDTEKAVTSAKSTVRGTAISGSSKLYKNYYYDMPKKEVYKEDGVFGCSEDWGKDSACLDGEKFIGIETMIIFKFIKYRVS